MKTSRILLAGLSALALLPSATLFAVPPSCCVTRGGETLGFAATEPGNFLDFGSQESVFTRQLDLFGADKVTLRNPSSDSTARVQVRLVDQKGHGQTFAVEIAAGDVASFDVPANAVHLFATSREQVELEVGNGGGVFDLQAPADDTNPTRTCDPADPTCDTEIITRCQRDWTLTCNESVSPGCAGLGPFTYGGRVEVDLGSGEKHVYWNQNFPTGNFTTATSQGLTATWVPAGSGLANVCPVSVTNSLDHTYTVTYPTSLVSSEPAEKDVIHTRDVCVGCPGGPGGPSDPDPICESNWTLTCDTSKTPGCASLGPFTYAGRVELVGTQKQVYWNQNTPTGSYTTVNPDGLTATWVPAGSSGSARCPIEVTNSLGHTYVVTRSSSLVGSELGGASKPAAPANDVEAQNLIEEICAVPWTLYCNTAKSPGCASLGPFTHDGSVIVSGGVKYVFWNQNSPTGNYTTQAPGGLTATWYPAGTTGDLRCPVEVQNSLGHWYYVAR